MKKIKPWIPIALIAAFFIALIVLRPKLVEIMSGLQQKQLSTGQTSEIETRINELYNYSENGAKYTYTFLEFGSTSCSACKNMQGVMEQIRNKYPDSVNVVFINVMDKATKEWLNYYGIATIPSQVLLDRNGKEFFRHSGYISEQDLSKQFKF